MKSIKNHNEEMDKTEVYMFTYKEEVKWLPFNHSGVPYLLSDKVESGRGGELLKKSVQQFPGLFIEVKCSEIGLEGKLYWKNALKNIIGRIEWDDGVVNKY